MAERPKRRTQTSPGLGDSGLRAKQPMPTAPPTSGVRESPSERPPPFSDSARSASAPIDRAAKVSTRRSRRSSIRVDDVGDVAVAIATKAARSSAPKLLKTRQELTSTPIDHRDAFVISLIDGKMNVQAIVDVSGMQANEIAAILERLERLGIISLP